MTYAIIKPYYPSLSGEIYIWGMLSVKEYFEADQVLLMLESPPNFSKGNNSGREQHSRTCFNVSVYV